MIKEMLERYGSNYSKVWTTNRLATVGSSEIGQCLRKIGFAKFETPPDEAYTDGWGYKLRGTVIEDHLWVPALRSSLPDGVRLLYAGEEQRTLALGFLSATPDGLLDGVSRDCLLACGVADIGEGRCVIVECKSLDPRSQARLPKEENSYQVNTAIGLIRDLTDHQPEYGIITYIDASDFSQVSEHVIKFDEGRYRAAEARAWEAISCKSPMDLLPEGKLAGGDECRYCPWQRQCDAGQVARLPSDKGVRLPPDAVKLLKELRDLDRRLATSINDSEFEQAKLREAMKQLLQEHGARAHKEVDGSWSVTWSVVKGRSSLDTKALEASGVDLSPYRKEGNASERLNVT